MSNTIIVIKISPEQYEKHEDLIIRLQRALAGGDGLTSQQRYYRNKKAKKAKPETIVSELFGDTPTASSKKAAPQAKSVRVTRFVEYTYRGKKIIRRCDGTPDQLEQDFANNADLKPRWVSPTLTSFEEVMMSGLEGTPLGGEPDGWKM